MSESRVGGSESLVSESDHYYEILGDQPLNKATEKYSDFNDSFRKFEQYMSAMLPWDNPHAQEENDSLDVLLLSPRKSSFFSKTEHYETEPPFESESPKPNQLSLKLEEKEESQV